MKILICDDHKIVREGLTQILLKFEGVTSIREAGTGYQALELLKYEMFDVMILDISLPDINGLEVLKTVKAKWPATNVLMLSMRPQEQYALRAHKLGAGGYLSKDSASEELFAAVKVVASGGKYISETLVESFTFHSGKEVSPQKHNALSEREFEIMVRLANGKTLLEIGSDLFISNKTVSTYRSRIMEKMDLTKNTELTMYCLESNLI